MKRPCFLVGPTSRSVLATILFLADLSPAASQTADPSASRSTIDIASKYHFEGVLAVTDRTHEVFSTAMGLANRGASVAHRTDERWLWASVTKQVTAVLVMQEVQKRRIVLDSTVVEVLPEFDRSNGRSPTIRQLLQHTSGLPNPDDTALNADDVPTFYLEAGPAVSNASRASGYCSMRPKASPGERFEYNNCDFLVLGAILERIAGRRYDELVAERISVPLGLASLGVIHDGERSPVIGYTAKGPHPDVNVATFGAAGALTGSAGDLLAFDRALLTNELLDENATRSSWLGDPKLGYEALGVWSFEARLDGCEMPVRLIERRGDIAGIQVRNVIAPDLGLAMVAFTNHEDLDFGEVWQGRGLAFELLGSVFCRATRMHPDPGHLRDAS